MLDEVITEAPTAEETEETTGAPIVIFGSIGSVIDKFINARRGNSDLVIAAAELNAIMELSDKLPALSGLAGSLLPHLIVPPQMPQMPQMPDFPMMVENPIKTVRPVRQYKIIAGHLEDIEKQLNEFASNSKKYIYFDIISKLIELRAGYAFVIEFAAYPEEAETGETPATEPATEPATDQTEESEIV